jgi:hypothetical protein
MLYTITMSALSLDPYVAQPARWPARGRHVLAQIDDESAVVYQAYRPSIGHFAAEHGHFRGGGFSLQRMSWIKPGFLWMMYRCGWASKPDQNVVLAIWIASATCSLPRISSSCRRVSRSQCRADRT